MAADKAQKQALSLTNQRILALTANIYYKLEKIRHSVKKYLKYSLGTSPVLQKQSAGEVANGKLVYNKTVIKQGIVNQGIELPKSLQTAVDRLNVYSETRYKYKK